MTDRPVLFSAPMVRALLEGRKTMTRRLAWRRAKVSKAHAGRLGHKILYGSSAIINAPTIWQKARPGDRYWVKETWGAGTRPCPSQGWRDGVEYQADQTYLDEHDDLQLYPVDAPDKICLGDYVGWQSSRFMFRWASRLTLVVTATKIEPLLDISDEDAQAEGFLGGVLDDGFGPRYFGEGWTIESPGTFASAAGVFQIAWSKLHPKWDGYSSPEVVAMSFIVYRQNIDQMEKEL